MNAASRSRRVRFPLPDRIDTSWNPVFPEFAAAANAVSLLMPHVEPYVARSVSSVTDDLDEPLRGEAATFVAQELSHQGQHRRINRRLEAGCPSLSRVDALAGRCYRWLERRWSTRWSLAFAAGFETSAFALARWSEGHLRTLFGAADEQITNVYLWHLAEEVEHKSVAFDVHARVDGSRWRYLVAGVVSLVLLATLTTAGTLVQLAASRRIVNPIAWWRLLRWSISLAFEVLPDLFVAAMPGHHPSQFSDPSLLVTWLQGFDTATASNPHWTARAA
jgi:predicted metal-dependent hydrolase